MPHPKPAVAIVGLSAELPSGNTRDSNLDHDAFFEFLLAKGEAYEQVPAERFNIDAWQGSNLGQVLPRKGCFLKNVTEFDHAEFGISTKDAYAMGLSTRKLLEHSFLALLDSGIDSRGQDVGVYMAGTAFDILSVAEPDIFEARGLLSGVPSMIANKVSYHLDLTGPSIPIDTACSSTLTALHLATQALRAGECKAALCKPFDAAADGFSRGEGVVVLVLKLLDEAIRDGDHVYASILGTAVNATGSAAPLYAPVADAQRKAMETAFGQTDCLPSEVDFVELHATGTAAGDPTEANWVGSAFTGSRELLLGSVKGNVGHLEITAFLASLSKVCSIFKTGLIPPTVNLATPNPAIHWKEYNMRAPTEVTKLSNHSGRSLISMTSSGIGGSNGHVILEGPPLRTYPCAPSEARPMLLVAGGLSSQTASAIAATIAVSDPNDLAALSTIHGRRSRQLTWRTFATWVPGQEKIEFPAPVLSPKVKAPIVFVFSGQGPQHFNMGRQLFRNFAAFRASILRMDKVYHSITGQSLVDDFGLFDDVTPKIVLPDIWPIAITQPALIILEMALYDLFALHSVFPDIVVAHSAGETAMLYASGAISQEMAVEIATARGLAMRSVEAFGGAMAAVGCNGEQAAEIIERSRDSDTLEIGCYNGPEAVALSGSDAAIDRAVEYAQSKGFFARKIKTRVAGHSSLMERCREDYQARMLDIYSRYPGQYIPSKTTYSTQTGLRWAAPFTADYMWTNARNPVYFAKAISTLRKDHPNAIFVEITPHPVLTSYIASVGVKSDLVIAPMRRTRDAEPFAEVVDFLGALGTLTCLGSNRVDFQTLNGPSALKGVSLPPYPFARKNIPYCSPSHQAALTCNRNGPLNYKGMALNMLTHPDLAEHVIKGEPILPATAYLEMAFEFGATHLWNVEFISMLPLFKDKVLRVEVCRDEHRWEVKSWSAEQPQISPRVHACGYMATDDQSDVSPTLDVKEIKARCISMPVKRFYDSIAYFAQYGPAFRQIRNIWTGDDEAIVEINNDFHTSDNRYIINPAILDSCLHVLVHPAFTGDTNQSTYYLPSKIQEVLLHTNGKLPSVLYSHSNFREWHPDYLVFDIVVCDPLGNKICSLLGAQIAKHDPRHHMVSFPSPRHALDLRALLSDLEGSTETKTLWIEATDNTLAGSAARGFTRSLRREGLRTDIRLALFHPSWTPDQRNAMLRYLTEFPYLEKEIIVDGNVNILVPRIVLQPSVVDQPSGTELWKYHAPTTSLIHSSLESPADGEVLVRVLSTSRLGPLAGIVGVVHATRSSLWAMGTRVVGVSASDLSNIQVFFEGEIAELPSDADIHTMSTVVVPLLILTLALGSHMLNPCRLVRQRLHIAEDDVTVSCIKFLWRILNLESSPIRDAALPESLSTSSIVIAGRLDSGTIQVLRSRMQPSASLFIWDDPVSGISPRLQRERWLAGDILQKYVPVIPASQSCLPYTVTGKEPHALIPPSYRISNPVQFDPTRVYLLLGGIGSFGIHVAIWMYSRGARRIVLTSRSGVKALDSSNQQALRRALGYLTSRPDLHLRLEACDSTSAEQMSALLNSITHPLAGCILLSAVLVDGGFMSFDPAHSLAYQAPIASKIDAFQVLEKVIAIDKLDFFISTSSVMSYGSAGQTNYSAANTALEWLTGRYPNAFSLVAPGITDSTFALDQLTSPDPRSPIWLKYAMSCHELCECIENGLKKLRTGPFSTYIPDLGWETVEEHLGTSPLYQHLLVPSTSPTTALDDRDIVETIVLNELHMDKTDLDPTVPLTSYGLDSLSASRMASAFKTLFTITQLQLLADVTLQDLQGRLTDSVDQDDKEIGNPVPFQPLQQHFTSALWAFQYTPDTPLTNFSELTAFYFARLKEARPHGPYRLGAYSATCLVAMELARRLEAGGETVLQLAFIDHFPLLYASPILLYDSETMHTRAFSEAQHDSAVRQIFSIMQNDPHDNWITKGPLNLEAKQIRIMLKKTGEVMLPRLMELLGDSTGTTEEERQDNLKRALGAAVDEIKAPVTVYIAWRGVFGELREACPSGEWDDYGIGYCQKRMEAVVFEKEGHLSLLHSKVFSDLLENSWERVA
ncbi:hypothetical protein K438DRAFT_1902128 [Mycena galopus ATCC 62051]|nr:hypothetical protein K438DRAFT_1902128 [Mycena galopus ATCC 62051]